MGTEREGPFFCALSFSVSDCRRAALVFESGIKANCHHIQCDNRFIKNCSDHLNKAGIFARLDLIELFSILFSQNGGMAMGYYIRVLSTSQECIPQEFLENVLKLGPFPSKLEWIVPVENKCWKQVILSHPDGPDIANIERDLVEPNSLGAEEIKEFQEIIPDCKPISAANWLVDYLEKVRCIYSFQVLKGAYHNHGWEILYLIHDIIFGFAPAIGQADCEGFTNEQEDHILWQFEDDSSELWDMAVLKQGKWVSFQMDLGNEHHRQAFLLGEVPDGVAIVSNLE